MKNNDQEIEKYKSLLNPPSGQKKYFDFEEDFVEENVRCIPMIVRLKMDKAGIKLKLAEWSRFSVAERIELATKSCNNNKEAVAYNLYLASLIKIKTGNTATTLAIDESPEWNNTTIIPTLLQEKAKEFDWVITIQQWQSLTNLQRFALLKLCRSGHENINFPKAMAEFKLL